MHAPTYAGSTSPSPVSPAGRHVEPARRAQLLARLGELVLSHGFTRVSMDEIASRLQCSKSTLYAVAAGKLPLMALVISRFFDNADTRVDKQLAQIADPAKRITAYLTTMGEELRRMRPECYADMTAHDLTRDIYATHALTVTKRLRKDIDEGVRAGSFRRLHAAFLAEAVNLITDGIQHGALLTGSGLSFPDACAQLRDLVLSTLTNTGYRRSPSASRHSQRLSRLGQN